MMSQTKDMDNIAKKPFNVFFAELKYVHYVQVHLGHFHQCINNIESV